jgi:hypothetical protein
MQDPGFGRLLSEIKRRPETMPATCGNICSTISTIVFDAPHNIILRVRVENIMWCNISNEEINAFENIEWKIERKGSSQRSARRGAEKVGLNAT